MDTPTAIYHVARDGQVIGAFPFPTLAAQFKSGAVKPTDHYLVEGTTDWKLISDLKPQFADHERQLKADAKAAREAEEKKAREAEAEQYRREHQEHKEAAERAIAEKLKPWKCHTCGDAFKSDGTARQYPFASGGWAAFGLMALSGFFAAVSLKEPTVAILAAILGLFAFGFVIAFGVETGLQQFHSYRPRCPNCSSPYCSKQGE